MSLSNLVFKKIWLKVSNKSKIATDVYFWRSWSSSINYLHNVEKPIIFVNAKDDPIVPEPLLEPIRKKASK